MRLGLGRTQSAKRQPAGVRRDRGEKGPLPLSASPEAKPRWDRIGLRWRTMDNPAVLLLLPQIFPTNDTALKYTYVELMQPVRNPVARSHTTHLKPPKE